MKEQKNKQQKNNSLFSSAEEFEFVSQRHRGFPFSVALYVNGIVVARISSCCEYRYAPGFQQGRKSCFRLSWLAGGIPCHRSALVLCGHRQVACKLVPAIQAEFKVQISLMFVSNVEICVLVKKEQHQQHFSCHLLVDAQVSETDTAPAKSWIAPQNKALPARRSTALAAVQSLGVRILLFLLFWSSFVDIFWDEAQFLICLDWFKTNCPIKTPPKNKWLNEK